MANFYLTVDGTFPNRSTFFLSALVAVAGCDHLTVFGHLQFMSAQQWLHIRLYNAAGNQSLSPAHSQHRSMQMQRHHHPHPHPHPAMTLGPFHMHAIIVK